MKEKSENDKQSNSENTNEDNSKLFKELYVLKITYLLIVLVFIATFISFEYVKWKILNLLDDINDTSFAEQIVDLTEFPKIANKMFLIITIIYLFINKDAYITELSLTGEERDENAICDAGINLAATILILLATYMNYTVLNRPEE